MKETVIRKLEALIERYEEVQVLLGEPDVISDQERFRNLTKRSTVRRGCRRFPSLPAS